MLLCGGDEILFVQDQLDALARRGGMVCCGSYQNANYGIMIGILVVIGNTFYNAKKIQYERVINSHCSARQLCPNASNFALQGACHTEILPLQPLYARRLVEQFEQHLVQPRLLLDALELYQFYQARKDALLVHHLKCGIVLVVSAVEEQESGDHVERGVIVVLQSQPR